MSHFPNQSYYGQYYFNPQWIPAAGGSQPSVVYNNVVNFTVGPDGTHYFHQTYSGQFVAPQGPTADMKMVREKIPPQQSTRAMRLFTFSCPHEKPSALEIREAQLNSVTEIAPKSPFFSVIRSAILFGRRKTYHVSVVRT